MLINKMQTSEDIEVFRKLPGEQLAEIIKDSPSHLLQIISDILFAFLLKENVPIEEAEELAERIKEKKMGLLFENAEKMDIQAERRNTAEARAEAEKQRKRAEEAEELAANARQSAIRLLVESCYELGINRAQIMQKLVEKFDLQEKDAMDLLSRYITENK